MLTNKLPEEVDTLLSKGQIPIIDLAHCGKYISSIFLIFFSFVFNWMFWIECEPNHVVFNVNNFMIARLNMWNLDRERERKKKKTIYQKRCAVNHNIDSYLLGIFKCENDMIINTIFKKKILFRLSISTNISKLLEINSVDRILNTKNRVFTFVAMFQLINISPIQWILDDAYKSQEKGTTFLSELSNQAKLSLIFSSIHICLT